MIIGKFADIRERIAQTKECIEKTIWKFDQFDSEKAAGYPQRWLPSIVTFTERAIKGFEVPWTSSPVERAMGKVAKRRKRDWMRCSEEELDALLQLSLARYINSEYYHEFFDEFLQRSTHGDIRCHMSITANGDEV